MAVEGESLVDSLVLDLVEVALVDHRPGWRRLEHGCALLPVCVEFLPPSCEPSIPCESL